MLRRASGLIPEIGSGEFLDNIVDEGVDVERYTRDNIVRNEPKTRRIAKYVVGAAVVLTLGFLGKKVYDKATNLEPRDYEYETSGSEIPEENMYS